MALQAGSAVVDITPRTPCYLSGYASRDHAHEDVHDPISLRALYARGASGDGVLISADIIWFYEEIIERITPVLERELGVLPANVLFCGTHTHSAPVVGGEHVNREWISVLEKQAVAAAAIAKTRLQEVTVKTGRGRCEIGINRREQKPSGEVVLGHNPDGPIDREVVVAGLDGADGKPVARICNFACHGVVLGPRNYRLSGDWPGTAASQIESDLDGAAYLFLNGGSGNVNSRIGPQDSFDPVIELASEFASEFQRVCENLDPLPEDDTVGGAELTVHLPRKLKAVEEGQGKRRPIRLRGLRIGPLRMVEYPGEMFSETAMGVKETSPHALTMVSSYTGGGHGGYVPVAEAYETGGYEIRASPYAEGAESLLRQGLLDLVNALP